MASYARTLSRLIVVFIIVIISISIYVTKFDTTTEGKQQLIDSHSMEAIQSLNDLKERRKQRRIIAESNKKEKDELGENKDNNTITTNNNSNTSKETALSRREINKRERDLEWKQRLEQSPLAQQTTPFEWTKANQSDQLNRTKIVGFITGNYARVALRWYDRLESLGYDNHYIICTDNETFAVLANSFPYVRTELSLLPPFPEKYLHAKYAIKTQKKVRMLFAHRWQYALVQLKLGNHVLITDVDNIFSLYYSTQIMEASHFDVYHALESKHPEDVFSYQGFVFCGGMGWFRSSPPTIALIEEMVRNCGIICDDQILLNRIIAYELDMEWNITNITTVIEEDSNTKDDVHTDRLSGSLIEEFTGESPKIGLRVKVWSHDFAYRGKNQPKVCPNNNWVSMPLVIFLNRYEGSDAKLNSYDIWDEACPLDKPINTKTYKYYRWLHVLDSLDTKK